MDRIILWLGVGLFLAPELTIPIILILLVFTDKTNMVQNGY